MWQKIKAFFKKLFKKEPIVVPPIPTTYVMVRPENIYGTEVGEWRERMWVAYENRIGILFRLTFPNVIVHFTDAQTGETISEESVPLSGLRQAHYDEIPEVRKTGFSREAAKAKGYGT
jgi:hypothetical protein